jgi:hypothetical protein
MDRSNNRDFTYFYYTHGHSIVILYEQTLVLTPSRLGPIQGTPLVF